MTEAVISAHMSQSPVPECEEKFRVSLDVRASQKIADGGLYTLRSTCIRVSKSQPKH